MSAEERRMWAQMRMDPRDISDVTGSTYTYLVNGHGPDDNWSGMFERGERVRLRIINASAMTNFNVRIPGLPMIVVQADGSVRPLKPMNSKSRSRVRRHRHPAKIAYTIVSKP
jgi:FtsP/CotA-like multicopper oxidase with cupredoxin domain